MSEVFIVNSSPEYVRMFRSFDWKVRHDMKGVDLVQFTGGEDVSPKLYGEADHPKTYTNPLRDKREILVYRLALKKGIPMAGICRGAQFLNVMCGGKLWQDVDNHAIAGTHEAVDVISGEVFDVTSTHHQMMALNHDSLAKGHSFVVAQARESTYRTKMLENGRPMRVMDKRAPDMEVICYKEPARALCFQPHPEYPEYRTLAERYFDYLQLVLK